MAAAAIHYGGGGVGVGCGGPGPGLVEIAPSSVTMQRPGPNTGPPGGGGGGPLGPLQGPPRSLKISPVKLQDETGDPMSQSKFL